MKKNKLLLISAAALVVAASAYFLFFNDKSVEVSTMNTYKTNIIKTIEVSGIINSKDIEVISLEPGKKVVKAYVEENDIVKKNQLLSELDADDLNISLQKAKLSLEDLNTKLSDLNNNNNDLVILKNTVEKNKENYSKVSNDLALAQEDLQRAENLYAERVISKAEYEKYVSAVNNLKSSLKTQELNLYDSNVNYKDKTDQRTLDKLSLQSQIESIKLDIESLNNKIEDTKIYSSIDGIVTEFPLKELQETLSGEKIIIHSNSSLELTALVSQEEAVLIDEGQKSIVTIDGLNTSYEGLVSFVSKVASTENDQSTKPKVEVKIEITNPDENIAFGYEGEAQITIDSQDNVLVVKNESVKSENNEKFVYILNNNAAVKTNVETGITDGYFTVIKSGIEENDTVIVNAPFDLRDGMMVKKAD